MKVGFLFDMDGVVVDNLSFHVEAWLLFCQGKGIPLSRAVFFQTLNGMNSKDTFEWLYRRPMAADEIAELEEEKEAIYRGFYADHRQAAPGLMDFLASAKAKGIPMALATSAGAGNIDFILDGLGIRSYFQVIVGGHEVQKGKPDPEIYLKAAQKLGLNPSDCWVFEDSLQGIKSGQAAGCRVVGITTTHDEKELSHTQIQSPNFINLLDKIC